MNKRTCALLALGLIVWLAAGLALAQDGAAAKAEPHAFTDYGCALSLPAGGELKLPGSPAWSADPQVAGMWYGPQGAPVAMIMLRVDTMDQPLNAAAFGTFCDTLLGNWKDDTALYSVTTANESLTTGQFSWNLIEVEDKSGAEPVYYSVFATYAGAKIYTISMYYMHPTDDPVAKYGMPVVSSFKLLN
jgi:hypothetical protein